MYYWVVGGDDGSSIPVGVGLRGNKQMLTGVVMWTGWLVNYLLLSVVMCYSY